MRPTSPASPDFRLLHRLRVAAEEATRQRPLRLRREAERCFRLAQGMASLELGDELAAMGRSFENEADAVGV
jgi:hypothetical protein